MKKINFKKILFSIFVTPISILVPTFAIVSCGIDVENLYNLSSNISLNFPSNKELDLSKIEMDSIIDVKGKGSSSVMPILELIKGTLNKMQYEATGSGDGLKVGLNPNGYDFGMTSSIKTPTNETEVETWIKNKVRTVTYAKDAIAIAMHLPNNIKTNGRPKIDIRELAKLYDNDLNTTTTWKKLLINEVDNDSINLNESPIAFGRIGGKSQSGTADGFWHILSKYLPSDKIDVNHEKLPLSQQTSEANSAVAPLIKNKSGSLSYLSLGFAIKNEDLNMKIATISADNDIWNPTLENANIGSYKWIRPFNIIYFANQNSKGQILAKYLLSDEGRKKILFSGFLPISQEILIKQASNTGIYLSKSDLEIYQNYYPGNDNFKIKELIISGKVGENTF